MNRALRGAVQSVNTLFSRSKRGLIRQPEAVFGIPAIFAIRSSRIAPKRIEEFGSACWARTSDPMINSHLLYRLS